MTHLNIPVIETLPVPRVERGRLEQLWYLVPPIFRPFSRPFTRRVWIRIRKTKSISPVRRVCRQPTETPEFGTIMRSQCGSPSGSRSFGRFSEAATAQLRSAIEEQSTRQEDGSDDTEELSVSQSATKPRLHPRAEHLRRSSAGSGCLHCLATSCSTSMASLSPLPIHTRESRWRRARPAGPVRFPVLAVLASSSVLYTLEAMPKGAGGAVSTC